jgi:asparagine synthase (glutamine-hydrolysing)
MCGITGAFSARDLSQVVTRMTDAVSHRGPDDCGIEPIRSAAGQVSGVFGHRRLSIIDLSSAGHQPMFSADGSLCVTFNGEIYNFAEIRRDLERDGAHFLSECDTEVLIQGWARHGADFLCSLRGMFALALWDAGKSEGYLIRDPFGIKPLYVAERNDEVIFASEVRSVLASGLIERRLSTEAIASYLANGSVAEPLTIIEGVYAVPPGCIVPVVRSDRGFKLGRAARFRQVFAAERDPSVAPRSHLHRIRNALRDSVRCHLVSDVPVALFLSGGIDSSAVAGLASEVSGVRLDSFTVTFAETDYSEAAPAREAARQFNTRHHEILLSGEDLLDALPEVFSSMDQPSMDGLNTFVVSRAVRSFGIKVVLSGLGGDELFAGYPSFYRARAISPLWRLPAPLRRAGAIGVAPWSDLRAARISALLADPRASHAAYKASRTLFAERQVEMLLPGFDPSSTMALDGSDGVDVNKLTLLQQVSLFELTGYMRNTLLRDSDVFSMAHGLELRVPFVDPHVASVARCATDALKLKRSESKPLLVDAVRDLLPPGSMDLPKRGFTLPFEMWMRGQLFSEVNSVLSGVRARKTGLSEMAVQEVWDQFQRRRPGMNWSRPWALYTLVRWAEHNGLSVENVPRAEDSLDEAMLIAR